MAIAPVGDIVMDVIKAADPAEAEAARAKLASGARAADGESFSLGAMPAASAQKRVEASQQKPFQRFEAMVLQNFIESMLPKGNETAFGAGMAGDMWKGLMAEKLSAVMSERGGIGIANRLLADHYKTEDGQSLPIGPAAEAPSQAGAGEAMLSSAFLDELQRKTLGTLTAPDAAPES